MERIRDGEVLSGCHPQPIIENAGVPPSSDEVCCVRTVFSSAPCATSKASSSIGRLADGPPSGSSVGVKPSSGWLEASVVRMEEFASQKPRRGR
jgi:hypothetical protein